MKKFLTFSITLLVSIFVFNNNVKAYTPNENDIISEHINGKNTITFYLDSSDNYVYYYVNGINKCSSFSYKCFSLNDYPYYWISQAESGIILYSTDKFKVDTSTKEVLSNGNTWFNSTNYKGEQRIYSYVHNYFLNSLGNNYNLVGNHTIYDVVDNSVYFSNAPEITITKEKEIKDDENIISEVIKISLSSIDDEKYNYYWKFEDSEWRKVDSSNFEENYTTYTIEQNGTFYFKIEDKNENIITSATYTTININRTPKVKYKIEIDEEDDFVKDEYVKNNRTIYNIKLEYSYMTNEYYSVYYNLKDGTKKDLGFNVQNYEIKYVNDDAIITIYIYDKNNNVVNFTTIDLQNINKDLNNPYIYVTGYNQENLPNSVAYKYINANDDDNKCYYKFGGGDLTSESCSSDETKFRKAYYNTSLSLYIYDNNNNILDEKHLNLNFINGFPRLEFESYYSAISKGQVLNIKLFDYLDNDTLYYSIDNKKWEQLATQELNSLIFTEDTQVYFKIYRNNEVIADSYYYVKIGNYSISISENNTKDEIKDLTKSQTGFINTFLKQINSYLVEFSKILIYFYNSLNPSIKACITALFVLSIICVVILIARGKR